MPARRIRPPSAQYALWSVRCTEVNIWLTFSLVRICVYTRAQCRMLADLEHGKKYRGIMILAHVMPLAAKARGWLPSKGHSDSNPYAQLAAAANHLARWLNALWVVTNEDVLRSDLEGMALLVVAKKVSTTGDSS
jgi:hypothetical protein